MLICAGENYAESQFCSLEAQHTLKQKKPFIPILIDDYQPKGWLDFMFGQRFYFRVTAHTVDAQWPAISKEIHRILSARQGKNALGGWGEHAEWD